jgi:hypothetical protein
MKRKAKQQIMGIILIVISIVLLYLNLQRTEGGFGRLWPSLVLLGGMFFYIFYFSTRRKADRSALMFLATFLATSSVPLFILTFTSFDNFKVIWPGFLFAAGMGFLAVYFYGKGKKFSLLLSFLATGASIVIWALYSVRYRFGIVTAVVILLVGAAFLTRGLIREQEPPGGKKDVPLVEDDEEDGAEKK